MTQRIQPATTPIANLPPSIDSADPVAQAHAQAILHARQARSLARQTRDDARQDRIQLLRAAADRQREMGDLALLSGCFQAAIGLGQAALSVSQGLPGTCKDPAKLAARNAERAGAQHLLTALGATDPGRMGRDNLAAAKTDLEASAEVAGKRADRYQDRVAESRGREGSLVRRLEKAHDARQAAERAAIRRP